MSDDIDVEQQVEQRAIMLERETPVYYHCPRCSMTLRDVPGVEIACPRCGWRER